MEAEKIMGPVRLFLVDRNQLFREGLKRLVDGQEYAVVGEAPSLNEAQLGRPGHPAVELLVIDFDGDATDTYGVLLEQMRAVRPELKVVVLTGDRSRQALTQAIGWSVDSYLTKDMSAEALARSFQLVMLGQQIFPTKLMMSMMTDGAEARSIGEPAAPAGTGLSPRELQILRALVNGKSNKAIARELSITEATVKVHLKALLRKVRVNNRTQAAVWALNQGLDRPAAASA
jgi:two-component system nitrate/nitrite response regulator NarL